MALSADVLDDVIRKALDEVVNIGGVLDHQCLVALWRSLVLCDGSVAGLSRTIKALLLSHYTRGRKAAPTEPDTSKQRQVCRLWFANVEALHLLGRACGALPLSCSLLPLLLRTSSPAFLDRPSVQAALPAPPDTSTGLLQPSHSVVSHVNALARWLLGEARLSPASSLLTTLQRAAPQQVGSGPGRPAAGAPPILRKPPGGGLLSGSGEEQPAPKAEGVAFLSYLETCCGDLPEANSILRALEGLIQSKEAAVGELSSGGQGSSSGEAKASARGHQGSREGTGRSREDRGVEASVPQAQREAGGLGWPSAAQRGSSRQHLMQRGASAALKRRQRLLGFQAGQQATPAGAAAADVPRPKQTSRVTLLGEVSRRLLGLLECLAGGCAHQWRAATAESCFTVSSPPAFLLQGLCVRQGVTEGLEGKEGKTMSDMSMRGAATLHGITKRMNPGVIKLSHLEAAFRTVRLQEQEQELGQRQGQGKCYEGGSDSNTAKKRPRQEHRYSKSTEGKFDGGGDGNYGLGQEASDAFLEAASTLHMHGFLHAAKLTASRIQRFEVV